MVSVKGISVQGGVSHLRSLSGVCPGGSLSRGFCPEVRDPPWTENPEQRPTGQRPTPLDRNPLPWTETPSHGQRLQERDPWTENPCPGQRPPDRDLFDRDPLDKDPLPLTDSLPPWTKSLWPEPPPWTEINRDPLDRDHS